MQALGYTHYMAQGGDWGSIVVRMMAVNFPQHCIAVHVNMIVGGPNRWYPFHFIGLIIWAIFQVYFRKDSMFNRMIWWHKEESGYQEIQGTKPQTLSYALTDSPLGMLAWIREKMEPLIDDEFVWSEEETITWAMVRCLPASRGELCNLYTKAIWAYAKIKL